MSGCAHYMSVCLVHFLYLDKCSTIPVISLFLPFLGLTAKYQFDYTCALESLVLCSRSRLFGFFSSRWKKMSYTDYQFSPWGRGMPLSLCMYWKIRSQSLRLWRTRREKNQILYAQWMRMCSMRAHSSVCLRLHNSIIMFRFIISYSSREKILVCLHILCYSKEVLEQEKEMRCADS